MAAPKARFVCRAKACGMVALVDQRLREAIFPQLHTKQVRFLGADVSTKFTGLVSLRLSSTGEPRLCRSELVTMPNTTSLNKTAILHARFAALRHAFGKFKQQHPTAEFEVAVEDKVLLASKGSIGSHSLAECIMAARLAAEIEFGHMPHKVAPTTARAGLGLNGGGTTREATKAAVVEYVLGKCAGLFSGDTVGFKPQGETDVADAYVLALSSVRARLVRELCADKQVRDQFARCHGQVDEDELLHPRMVKWVEAVFPQRGDR